jgi:hypothetical protein
MQWTIAFVPEGILCGASILLSRRQTLSNLPLSFCFSANLIGLHLTLLGCKFIMMLYGDSLLGGSTAGYVNGRFVSFLRPVASGQVVGRRVFSRSQDVVCG